MHYHHQQLHHDKAKRAPVPELTTLNGVVLSVVYVTADPTFTGVIGSYSTVTDDDSSASQTQTTSTSSRLRATAVSSAATTNNLAQTSSQTSNSIINLATVGGVSVSATLSNLAISSTLATSSQQSTAGSATNTAVAGASTTDSSSSSSTPSDGMSAGAKAGLAIGILVVIGALAALCLFLLGKKKKQRERRSLADNEKNYSGNGGAMPGLPTPPIAPRLTLRPVSRLVPEMMGGSRSKDRSSQGNMLTTFNASSNGPDARGSSSAEVAGAPAHRAVTQTPTVQEENPFQDPQNPFADPEKSAGLNSGVVVTTAPIATAKVVSSSPIQHEKPLAAPPTAAVTVPVAAPAPATAPAPAPALAPVPVVSASHPTLIPASIPAPISIPAVGAVIPAAPSPVVAQGPGPEQGQSNVYRILMDFNPTMEDELGLRAGQHVRMLHEYDDGWALCIKLDRSQQGVVPRTCLANKPSKPRPMPGQNSPRFRPGIPISGRNSPTAQAMTTNESPVVVASPPIGTPSTSRPASIASRKEGTTAGPLSPGAFNQAPRPLSPGPRPQKRSMSPGPYGASGPKPMAGVSQRRRSNSANALSVRERRESPPGPSKLGPGLPPIRADSPGPDSPGLAM